MTRTIEDCPTDILEASVALLGPVARARVALQARMLEGTPWVHQGRVGGKNGGVDCVGAIVVACAWAGVYCEQKPPTYRRQPRPDELLAELSRFAVRIRDEEGGPGDIVALYERPRHVGLLSSIGLVHAQADIGRVVDVPFGEPWLGRRHSTWRIRQPDEMVLR